MDATTIATSLSAFKNTFLRLDGLRKALAAELADDEKAELRTEFLEDIRRLNGDEIDIAFWDSMVDWES